MTRPDHRGTLAFIAAVVAGLLVGLAMTQDWTHASAAVTREGLLATFESDMRRVVYRWDTGDPRSEDTRQRALFEFVYQTYESSAWIPQSLFDRQFRRAGRRRRRRDDRAGEGRAGVVARATR